MKIEDSMENDYKLLYEEQRNICKDYREVVVELSGKVKRKDIEICFLKELLRQKDHEIKEFIK